MTSQASSRPVAVTRPAGKKQRVSGIIVSVQGGRIAVYLMYSFLTLILLLLVARP